MVVRRDPVREWREQYARECLRIDFEPLSNAPFRAFAEPVFPALDGFCVVRAALSPGVTFRDEALVRDGNDAFALLIPRPGSSTSRIGAATSGSPVATPRCWMCA